MNPRTFPRPARVWRPVATLAVALLLALAVWGGLGAGCGRANAAGAAGREQAPEGQTLALPVRHVFRGRPLAFHEPLPPLSDGTRLELTRLAYLVSDLRVVGEDGTTQTLAGQFFHVDAPEGTTSPTLALAVRGAAGAGAGAGAGARLGVWRLAFTLGVSPEINRGDAAQWPAGHSLNPIVNNLHWSWQGGYIFLAVEGFATPPGGKRTGILYHLGNDPQRMEVSLQAPAGLALGDALLLFHVDRLWEGGGAAGDAGGGRVGALEENGLTHSSGAGDTLAPRLARNAERAFELVARPRGGPSGAGWGVGAGAGATSGGGGSR